MEEIMKQNNNCKSSIFNKKHTVLLVDDDPNILKITGKYLKNAGYRVTSVVNSEKAVELLESSSFDVVITDMIMENIDGLELLKIAKALDKETRVIVLTGYGNLASAVNAFRFGADDYLIKPWLPEEIMFRISRCIENLENKRKHRQAEKALQDSELRFRTLYEKAPFSYQSLDKQGRFIQVNDAWLDTFGYFREEVVGRFFW